MLARGAPTIANSAATNSPLAMTRRKMMPSANASSITRPYPPASVTTGCASTDSAARSGDALDLELVLADGGRISRHRQAPERRRDEPANRRRFRLPLRVEQRCGIVHGHRAREAGNARPEASPQRDRPL